MVRLTGGKSVEKAEYVRYLDYSHPSRALLVQNLIAQRLHLRPVHFRPEMVFRGIAVKEPCPGSLVYKAV